MKRIRNSNIELLRIIMMVVIVAHYYVVNSGITDLYDFHNVNLNMIFTQLVGGGGKQQLMCFAYYRVSYV